MTLSPNFSPKSEQRKQKLKSAPKILQASLSSFESQGGQRGEREREGGRARETLPLLLLLLTPPPPRFVRMVRVVPGLLLPCQ